jgi:alkylation response protein AidB-like acyl-CoA dehydrogenase
MDFDWTEEDRAFRARVRAFLERELPANWHEISRHGPGSPEQTEFSLAFCPKLAQADLLVPHWPAQWGGADRPTFEHFILGEEMWAAGEPRGAQYMNVNWIGPTLMRFGSAAQQQRYIPEMAAGKAIWCQGFSEPNAGSDLASLTTRAERDGDTYVINGTKIWTSYAAMAQHCFLLARTAGTAKGKAGIAIFLVPMETPGIEVRAIPSLIGHGDIHEVFLTDVRIPVSARLGEEGEAWSIINYSLVNERVGIPRYELAARVLGDMVQELTARGAFDDPILQARAGAAAAACEAARILVYRTVDKRARGEALGSEASMARVLGGPRGDRFRAGLHAGHVQRQELRGPSRAS